MKSKLPTYELTFALEGLIDEFGDPVEPVERVVFERDYLSAGDMCDLLEKFDNLDDADVNQAKMFGVALELLPRMTNLTEEQAAKLHARDFMALVGILGPFLKF